MTYPILEYDPDPRSFIEPSDVTARLDVSKRCVICFFKEVVQKVAEEFGARVVVENRWEDGPHPVYEIEHRERRLAFFHPGVGASLASGLLEEVIAFGCRKFIAIGGCGVLSREMEVGKLIIVHSAIRDEGVSYHYLNPSREIEAQEDVHAFISATMEEMGIPHVSGKTWTTDAPYRETREKIQRRRDEGCIAVEMEAAGLMAVAQFRGVKFGQILYAGDDLSGDTWDNRGWQSRADVRDQLFWIAADILHQL
jgi:uridine phosphorylase